ncbi:MAG TPA: MBL fold metallo-hydrolase [Microbacterium sp.]|nr:MBL fold metallo-hydrolase [Microbacterium sp.]
MLVDAGLPAAWSQLLEVLRSLGAGPSDISAVLLTHGHVDHVGVCHRLAARHGVASHVHSADQRLARHPYRSAHEASPLTYPVRNPATVPTLVRMVAAGALGVKGVVAKSDVVPGVRLDLPGGLTPVWSPGHTQGHCAYFKADEGLLFTGDALVTYDPFTAERGPRIVAGAATADSSEALDSLAALEATGAALLLPGHGEPFRDGAAAAAEQARAVGPS